MIHDREYILNKLRAAVAAFDGKVLPVLEGRAVFPNGNQRHLMRLLEADASGWLDLCDGNTSREVEELGLRHSVADAALKKITEQARLPRAKRTIGAKNRADIKTAEAMQ